MRLLFFIGCHDFRKVEVKPEWQSILQVSGGNTCENSNDEKMQMQN